MAQRDADRERDLVNEASAGQWMRLLSAPRLRLA